MTDTWPDLLIIGNREALAWILSEQRTAFLRTREHMTSRLRPGHQLLLYTTGGCFLAPGRDVGRIIGTAEVTSKARHLDTPVTIGTGTYDIGCDLSIRDVTPARTGLPLGEYAARMPKTFPKPDRWGASLRRALAPVHPAEAELLCNDLAGLTRPLEDVLTKYVEIGVPPRAARTAGP